MSTACKHLQEEGVPRSSVLHGFRVAEDICVDVLRELSLSVRTTHVGGARLGHEAYRARVSVDEPNNVGEACRQKTRNDTRSSVTVPMLAHLAAGLQHCAGCEHATVTDQERVSKVALFTPCGVIYGFSQRGVRFRAVGTCWTSIQVCADVDSGRKQRLRT